LGDGGAVNVEDGCRLLFLAAEYGEQGIDLRLVRIGIEEPAYDAAALMHGSRPAIDGSNLEPIEPQIAEPSLFDKHAFKAFAQALGRLAVEFARAAVIATARCYLGALDRPINIGHGNTPDCSRKGRMYQILLRPARNAMTVQRIAEALASRRTVARRLGTANSKLHGILSGMLYHHVRTATFSLRREGSPRFPMIHYAIFCNGLCVNPL
jgi:hypothetical protein